MKRWNVVVVGVMILAAGCGSDDSSSEPEATSQVGASGDSDSSAVDDAVQVVGGDLAEGQVSIDGTVVDYVTVVPDGFELGDEAPVLLAFPPGGQSLDQTRSLAANTYLAEAVERGWVVVSPAAPGGELFFQGSEALVPSFMDWIETWVSPESGRFHIAGVSNGGLSSFRVAGQQPDRVASVIAFPGYPRSEEDVRALEGLTDIPVRMFAGATDTGWVEPMQQAEATLNELGGDVVLVVFPGEGHIVGALSDGVQIFDELDAARP